MTFLLDDCVDRQVGDRLAAEGHEVAFAWATEPFLPDDAVLSLANEKRAVLVTADKDFGELVYRTGRATGGVVLVRLAGLSPESKAAQVSVAVKMHGDEMAGAFSVVSPGRVRVRRCI